MSLPINPYRTGEPVGYTDDFVGREDIVARVRGVLDDPQTNVMLLYGQRRVGKTSILQFLEKKLADNGLYFPVYFDLHGKSDLTLAEILIELAGTITGKLDLPDSTSLLWKTEEAFRKEWLRDALDELPETSSLVLLLDEFDVLTDPSSSTSLELDQFPARTLFGYLRQLSQEYARRLQFIFVIGRHKEDLSIVAQSLFRDAPQCLVSLLDERDVIELVRLSEKNNTLYWNESAIGQVLQLTNGHPLLTQQLCSRVWESVYEYSPQERPIVTPESVAAVICEVLQDAGKDFVWLWESLSAAERVAAAALAEVKGPLDQEGLENLLQTKNQLRIVIREARDAVSRLKDRDVFEVVNGDFFKFRVELIRQWVVQNKPLEVVQKEIDGIQTIAESLYRAALKYYEEGELEKAVDVARQAFDNNRYHVGVNQLLADILIEQYRVNEALELLEKLYDHQPTAASARLIKVYQIIAKDAKGDDERLAFYKLILKISPSHQETLEKWREIWEFKARYNEELARSSGRVEDWQAASDAYRESGLESKAREIEHRIQQQVASVALEEIKGLEQARRYSQALAVLDDLAKRFPGLQLEAHRVRLIPKVELERCYEGALAAWAKNDRTKAQDLLVKVVDSDPSYKDTTLCLHHVVTGVDFLDHQRYSGEQGEYEQTKIEAQQVPGEVGLDLTSLKIELEEARLKIEQLVGQLDQARQDFQRESDNRRRYEWEIDALKKQTAVLQLKLQEQESRSDKDLKEAKANVQNQMRTLEKERNREVQGLQSKIESLEQEKEELKSDLDKKRDMDRKSSTRRDLRVERLEREKKRYVVALIIVSALFLLYIGCSLLAN